MNGKKFQVFPEKENGYNEMFDKSRGGGTFPQQILKGLGFWFSGDKNTSMWFIDSDKLRANPDAQAALRNLGISLAPLGPSDRTPQAPAVRPSPKVVSNPYTLGESVALPGLPAGSPIVVYDDTINGKSGLYYVDESLTPKMVPSLGHPSKYIRSIRDENDNPISSNSIKALFDLYWKKKEDVSDPVIEEEKEEEKKEETGEGKKDGRIPEEMISPYQKAIESSFTDSDENIVIDALAGTGKTSMLEHLASFKKPSERWLYVVFNSKNKLEAKDKFPPSVEVETSHSFLLSLLKQMPHGDLPSSDLDTSFDKAGAMVDDALEISTLIERNYNVKRSLFPEGKVFYNAKVALKKIVDMCKANAVDPNAPDIRKRVSDVIDQYDINTDIQNTDKDGNLIGRQMVKIDELIEEAILILKESLPGANLSRYERIPWSNNRNNYKNNRKKYESAMNFDDILWFTALNSQTVPWPRYSVVLADEVQDFNKCQQIMLENLKNAGARIIAVGDPNQSIYMFRGADSNSFNHVKNSVLGEVGSAHELPVNYRCAPEIIEYVNNNSLSPVHDLQAGLSHKGKVIEGQDQEGAIRFVIDEFKTNGRKLKTPTAFIARNNDILQTTALQLIAEDVDFEFIGVNISKKLLDLCYDVVGKGKKQVNLPMEKFVEELHKKFNSFLSKFEDMMMMRDNVEDRKRIYKALSHILSTLLVYDNQGVISYKDKDTNIKTSNDFISYLRKKFKGLNFDSENSSEIERIKDFQKRDPREYVALCSAHRSKGLEFERVYILNKDQFPSKKAKTSKEIDQEKNAWYVTMTRAKNELHLPEPPPKD